jgi:capsular polysaccharide synthesis protein
MYWETPPGAHRPPYLDVCLETIRSHLDDEMFLHELDEETVFEWLPDCPRLTWQRLGTPVRRSDYARVRLIERYGGTWIDADSVLMMSLRTFVEPLAVHTVVSGERFTLGMFAAQANAPLIRAWRIAQDNVLASSDDWATLPWAALGADCLLSLIDHHEFYRFPQRRIVPVEWYEWRRFLSRLQPPATIMKSSPISVLLFNKAMGQILAHTSRAEILSDDILLSRLLRLALHISNLSEETKLSMRLSPLSGLRFTRVGRRMEEGLRSTLARR